MSTFYYLNSILLAVYAFRTIVVQNEPFEFHTTCNLCLLIILSAPASEYFDELFEDPIFMERLYQAMDKKESRKGNENDMDEEGE
ncbi:hypothetical protein Hanom_Chr06g00569691 [Helianthus anomalus]